MHQHVHELPERILQRAVQAILADPHRLWRCSNGDEVQIVAAGLVNVHDGPDFRDMAVLHNGTVYVGNGEFHRKASDWMTHDHQHDRRYASLLVHVVLADDAPVPDARWTIVLDPSDLWRGIRLHRERSAVTTELPVEELQHFALLRLLRTSAEAHVHIRRVGTTGAVQAMASAWLDRLGRKRHRPVDEHEIAALRVRVSGSAMGRMAQEFTSIAIDDVLGALERAECERIAREGAAMRRELLVNVVLPVCVARAGNEQRIRLFQWYWSAKAVHPYGVLRRRFPQIAQDYVWQQQGMLEFLRDHSRQATVCAEVIREYGFARTLEFLHVSGGSVSL